MCGSSSSVPLPPTSRIQIVESNENRQVIYIPEGGAKTRSLGNFVLVWILVTVVITWLWSQGEFNDNLPVIGIVIVGGFWFIGLGFASLWLKLRFTKTILLLERDRLVMQRVFLGFKSITETPFLADTKAKLVTAYTQNDDPVYSVAVISGTRRAEFGTQLSREEKDWFVEHINEFLRGPVNREGEAPAEPR